VSALNRPFWPKALLAAAVCIAATISVARAEDRAPQLAAAPTCTAPDDVTRLMNPLARTGKRLAAGEAVKIVAIGSSSTAGAGASSPDKSYPSRLAIEMKERFPYQQVSVVNQGVNGEEAADMVKRLDNVMAEKPDLILWQVGANAVLRDTEIPVVRSDILEGLRRMKASGADVILIDPQFAPKVLAKKEAESMVDLIATTAKATNVDLFRRFAVMRHWRNVARIPFESFISPDELHMNDWSYGCVAKLLAGAIAEAATRSTLTAGVSAR
jgi:lysophospholipase L1-like esterase